MCTTLDTTFGVLDFHFQDCKGRISRSDEMLINVDQHTLLLGTGTLAFSPLVKRQVFCVGDRLKMDRRKALASTIVAPK